MPVDGALKRAGLGALLMLVAACGGGNVAMVAPPKAPPTEVREEAHVPQKSVSIAAGDFHTCSINVGGTVMCWGRDRDGELGDGGGAENRLRPVAVPNLRDVEQIAAGNGFSCARLRSGKVRCWGSGRILGDGRVVERLRPTDVEGVEHAVELEAGGVVACVRTQAGEVRCWGTPTITSVKGLRTVGAEDIAVAGAHACARTLDRKITCWGEGLWPGGTSASVAAADWPKLTALSTGDAFACVMVDGKVRCWGRNDQGELGAAPDKETHGKPVPVKRRDGKPLDAMASIVSAEARSCTVARDGAVWCWGSNQEGTLGRGTTSISGPAEAVPQLAEIAQVALGAGHVCARSKDGAVSCWGANRQGQVGDGTTTAASSPVLVKW